MREAAWALFLLGTEHGGDPGTFDRDSAEIRASWDRVFEKAWIASPLRRPRADDDAREERLKAAESQAKVCREDAEFNATRAERAEVATKAATRDRDEWKARAERAEALLHDVEAALDNAGVARSTAPTVDACTDRDTPDRYPRLAQADRVKVLAKSEKDILDRLLDADTATRKAEAERDSARALLREAMERSRYIGGTKGITPEFFDRIAAELEGV